MDTGINLLVTRSQRLLLPAAGNRIGHEITRGTCVAILALEKGSELRAHSALLRLQLPPQEHKHVEEGMALSDASVSDLLQLREVPPEGRPSSNRSSSSPHIAP